MKNLTSTHPAFTSNLSIFSLPPTSPSYLPKTQKSMLSEYEARLKKPQKLAIKSISLPRIVYNRLPKLDASIKKFRSRSKHLINKKKLTKIMSIKGITKHCGFDKTEGTIDTVDHLPEADKELRVSRYKFLNASQNYSLNDIKLEKEDSFLKSTKPKGKVLKYLGLFGGLFDDVSLENYFPEATFILEQDYSMLKSTTMMNEIIRLGLAILETRMLPGLATLDKLFQNLFQGIEEVAKKQVKMVYPERIILKFIRLCKPLIEERYISVKQTKYFVAALSAIIDPRNEFGAETVALVVNSFVQFCVQTMFEIGDYFEQGVPINAKDDMVNSFYLKDALTTFREHYKQAKSTEDLESYIQAGFFHSIDFREKEYYKSQFLGKKDKHLLMLIYEIAFFILSRTQSMDTLVNSIDEDKDSYGLLFSLFDGFFHSITQMSELLTLEGDIGDSLPHSLNMLPDVLSSDMPQMSKLRMEVSMQMGFLLQELLDLKPFRELGNYLIEIIYGFVDSISRIVSEVKVKKDRKKLGLALSNLFRTVLSAINLSTPSKKYEKVVNLLNSKILSFLDVVRR